MAAKEVRFSEDARARMVKGVNVLANAVKVKVLEVDRQGRVRLSMKAVGADEGVTA